MRQIWYYLINIVASTGLYFTLRRRRVSGLQHFPRKGPAIIVLNHQNALIDAIQVPTLPPRPFVWFLARADLFKSPLLAAVLRSLNMMPIYRLRDGRNTLARNEAILNHCADLLVQGHFIQIFPEGNHHTDKRVRHFKTGFADIAFRALRRDRNLDLKIVPAGLNYDHTTCYPASVHLRYGPPIRVRDYFDAADIAASKRALTHATRRAIQQLTTHIEEKGDAYHERIRTMRRAGIDFLDPEVANQFDADVATPAPASSPHKRPSPGARLIRSLFALNSLPPLLLWRRIKRRTRDAAFHNTLRFALILTVFPAYYAAIALAIGLWAGHRAGFAYLAGSILLGMLRKQLPPDNHCSKTKR